MPAPLSFVDLEGILTGMRMLACVSLLRVNRKAQQQSEVEDG